MAKAAAKAQEETSELAHIPEESSDESVEEDQAATEPKVIETARVQIPARIDLEMHQRSEEAKSGETNHETANIVNLESSLVSKALSSGTLNSSVLIIKDEAGALFEFTTAKAET